MSTNLLPLDQQWARAVATYTAMTKKTCADGLNRQAINLLYVAARDYAPVAMEDAIKAIPATVPWWPAHIVNEMKKRNFYTNRKGVIARRRAGREREGDLSGGYLLRLEVARSLREGRGHRNERAAQLSEKLLRSRANAVGFVRGFFVSMVRSLGARIKGKGFPGIRATMKRATDADLTVSVSAEHVYRGGRSDVADWVNVRLSGVLESAIPSAIADMEQYWRTHAPKGKM